MLTRVGTLLYFHLPLILHSECHHYFLHGLRQKLAKRDARGSKWRRLGLLRDESSAAAARSAPPCRVIMQGQGFE